MATLSQILDRKGRTVHTIDHSATVFDAVKTMVMHDVGALIVTNGTEIRGIFTERDYLRRIILEGRSSRTTNLMEVVTERLVCVGPDSSLEDCMSTMTQERIRHLPVIDGQELVGIVSIGDLVKHLSREREIEIRTLTDFIAGRYPG